MPLSGTPTVRPQDSALQGPPPFNSGFVHHSPTVQQVKEAARRQSFSQASAADILVEDNDFLSEHSINRVDVDDALSVAGSVNVPPSPDTKPANKTSMTVRPANDESEWNGETKDHRLFRRGDGALYLMTYYNDGVECDLPAQEWINRRNHIQLFLNATPEPFYSGMLDITKREFKYRTNTPTDPETTRTFNDLADTIKQLEVKLPKKVEKKDPGQSGDASKVTAIKHLDPKKPQMLQDSDMLHIFPLIAKNKKRRLIHLNTLVVSAENRAPLNAQLIDALASIEGDPKDALVAIPLLYCGHWTMLTIDYDPGTRKIQFYDPMGNRDVFDKIRPELEQMKEDLNADKRIEKKWEIDEPSSTRHQFDKISCGVHCLDYVEKRLDGISYEDYMKSNHPADEIRSRFAKGLKAELDPKELEELEHPSEQADKPNVDKPNKDEAPSLLDRGVAAVKNFAKSIFPERPGQSASQPEERDEEEDFASVTPTLVNDQELADNNELPLPRSRSGSVDSSGPDVRDDEVSLSEQDAPAPDQNQLASRKSTKLL